MLLYNSKNSFLASFKTNLKINFPTREKLLPKRKEKKPPPPASNQVFSPNCSINLVKLCYKVISRRWTVLDQPSEQWPCKHVHIFQRLITKHCSPVTRSCRRLPRAGASNSAVLTGSLDIEHLMMKCAKEHVPLSANIYEIWKVLRSTEIFDFKVHASDGTGCLLQEMMIVWDLRHRCASH